MQLAQLAPEVVVLVAVVVIPDPILEVVALEIKQIMEVAEMEKAQEAETYAQTSMEHKNVLKKYRDDPVIVGLLAAFIWASIISTDFSGTGFVENALTRILTGIFFGFGLGYTYKFTRKK